MNLLQVKNLHFHEKICHTGHGTYNSTKMSMSKYYEINSNNFGINFSQGIEARELAKKFKKANRKLSHMKSHDLHQNRSAQN